MFVVMIHGYINCVIGLLFLHVPCRFFKDIKCQCSFSIDLIDVLYIVRYRVTSVFKIDKS